MAAKKAGKAKGKKAGAKKVAKAVPVGRKPAEVDTRLPSVGTIIEKRDRHGEVRCSCEVTAEGIKYAGNLCSSLSGAAMAAAKDLALTNKTQNGFVFWGLSKPPRPAASPVEALQRAWVRPSESRGRCGDERLQGGPAEGAWKARRGDRGAHEEGGVS